MNRLLRICLSALACATVATQMRAAVFGTYLKPTDFASLGDFHPASNVTVDAATGTMTGGANVHAVSRTQAGTTLWVFTFSSFTLDAGITINFINTGAGSAPVAFLSQGDMTIAGTIRADGQNGRTFDGSTFTVAKGGPGGYDATEGPGAGTRPSSPSYGGGGGGGFGGPGGSGGGAGSIGGVTYGNLTLEFVGGSGGAGGNAYSVATPGFGGGGGGALQIGAVAKLTVSGVISASGGEGAAPNSTFGNGGGGGGGSGGAILMYASDILISADAQVVAAGGNGGSGPYSNADYGGGGGGGGRIYIAYGNTGLRNGTVAAAGGLAGSGGAGNTTTSMGHAGVAGVVEFVQDSSLAELRLNITLSAGKIVLSWPASVQNALLDITPTIGVGANWTTLGSQNPTTIQLDPGNHFFRLHLR